MLNVWQATNTMRNSIHASAVRAVQSIYQSKQINIAPYVASESEARDGRE